MYRFVQKSNTHYYENKKIRYHFVLDKSGSMNSCRESTIQGVNSQLKTIKQLQKEFPEQWQPITPSYRLVWRRGTGN